MRDPSAVNSNPSGCPVSAIGAKAVIAKFGYVQPVAGYIQRQMIDAADHRTQGDLCDQLESVYRLGAQPSVAEYKTQPQRHTSCDMDASAAGVANGLHAITFDICSRNPMKALIPMTWMTLSLKRNSATAAAIVSNAEIQSNDPVSPFGHSTW